jgi:sugar phosphate isomerase/epimerase
LVAGQVELRLHPAGQHARPRRFLNGEPHGAAQAGRRAIGLGHTPPEPIVAALRGIGFAGHLAAEVFPLPTATAAAAASIETFRRFVA